MNVGVLQDIPFLQLDENLVIFKKELKKCKSMHLDFKSDDTLEVKIHPHTAYMSRRMYYKDVPFYFLQLDENLVTYI